MTEDFKPLGTAATLWDVLSESLETFDGMRYEPMPLRLPSAGLTLSKRMLGWGSVQTFWNEFLAVSGLDRRRVAVFKRKVKGLEKGSGRGCIDLLWPGLLMAEHKSKGRDLDEATQQARILEQHERPQWVAVSDFRYIRLQEVATGEAHQFPLEDFPKQVERFAFLIGKQLRHQREADLGNVKSAQQMGQHIGSERTCQVAANALHNCQAF